LRYFLFIRAFSNEKIVGKYFPTYLKVLTKVIVSAM
jgi:hypothetical protein